MSSSAQFSTVVEGLLADGLRVRFRANGRSMLPTVRDGECVVVAPVRAADVEVGDVLLCRTWRGEIAHRVTRVARAADGARRFELRGDASVEADAPVCDAQVRGRVESVERRGRSVSLSIAGGALGRALLTARLRSGPALVALARACIAAARPLVAAE
jgi:hypothetical protein